MDEAGARIREAIDRDTAGDEPDETPPDEPDTPDEPPPSEPPPNEPSETQVKRVTAALDKEDERHAKRYRDVMGADAELLQPCPLCWRPGFIFPPEMMQPESEVQATLLGVLVNGAPAQLEQGQDAQPCDECRAYGLVLTGSKAPGQETKLCRSCGGQGWRNKPVAVEPMAPVAAWQPPPPVPAAGTGAGGAGDLWGRPPGHPDYGREPAAVGYGR